MSARQYAADRVTRRCVCDELLAEPQQQSFVAGPPAQHAPVQASPGQGLSQVVITDRDFTAALRKHGLDWIAGTVALNRHSVPLERPKPKPVLTEADRVPKKRGPKKGTKYKPRKQKMVVAAGGASRTRPPAAAGGVAALSAASEDVCRQEDEPDETDFAWENTNEDGFEFGGEADQVLHELIEMYESQHGQLPTDDAIRSWMTTLQEATATSALASGVLGSDEQAAGRDGGMDPGD